MYGPLPHTGASAPLYVIAGFIGLVAAGAAKLVSMFKG